MKKKTVALLGLATIGLAALGCGSKSDEENAGNAVKELPVQSPVTPAAQKEAQTQVDNDPKAEKPRADGDRSVKSGP